MRLFIIVLMYFFNSFPAFAQAVSAFRLVQIENTVKIEFSILGGNTCNGIDILRSTDSIMFHKVGDISGICGSTSYDISYDFIDQSPVLNSDIYYKLDLKTLGFSGILKIHTYDASEKLTIQPNPVITSTVIHYQFDNGHSANIKLIDAAGKLIYENKNITDNPFNLEMESIKNGLYFLEITTNNGSRILGKIVKN